MNAVTPRHRPGSAHVEQSERFFDRPIVKKCAVILAVAAIATAAWVVYGGRHANSTLDAVEMQICIDSETGKSFTVRLEPGMHFPVKSPFTGRETGYPAELCYWTKDGQPKSDPTPVLLNSYLGKAGPTFCPDCGRLVVPHNPRATADRRPPPTLEEWKAMHPDGDDGQ